MTRPKSRRDAAEDPFQEPSFLSSVRKHNSVKPNDQKKKDIDINSDKDSVRKLFSHSFLGEEVEEKDVSPNDRMMNNLKQSLIRFQMLKKIQNQLNLIRQNQKKTSTATASKDVKSQSSANKKAKRLEELRTRQSQRLRQQMISNNGRNLPNRIPNLNEGEIRSEDKASAIEKLRTDTDVVLEGNCYNYFIAKRISIDQTRGSKVPHQRRDSPCKRH